MNMLGMLKMLQQVLPLLRGKETVTLAWSSVKAPENIFKTTFELIVSDPTTEKKIAHVIVGIYE